MDQSSISALVRRLELTELRQKRSLEDTQRQLEAARQMQLAAAQEVKPKK